MAGYTYSQSGAILCLLDHPATMAAKITKFTFLLNGISALLGWNAVLSSFDYYDSKFPGRDVYTWFPVPLFLMYVVVGVCWREIHKRMSYKHLVMIGLIITNICMVALPLVAYYMKDSTPGFAICLVICGVIGLAGNMVQLSCFAILNFMTLDVLNLYNQGLAVSGLTMILIRVLILGAKGAQDSNNFSSILIYIILTILVNVTDIAFNIRFFRSEAYLNQVQSQQFHKLEEENDEQKLPVKQEEYFKKLLNTHKEIFPYDIFIYLNYVQTFMLFPNLTFSKQFHMNPVWGIALLNLIFNIGDLAGRVICNFRNAFNRQSLYYLFGARFVFFWTIIAIARNIKDPLLESDAFAFVNIFLFALTNGIATNGNFALTFETVKINKSYAGVLCGLLLQMGIFSGTLLAIPLSKVA